MVERSKDAGLYATQVNCEAAPVLFSKEGDKVAIKCNFVRCAFAFAMQH